MDQPIYAVGDLHGHPDQLERVIALIDDDGGSDAQVVFLGDYVDRGPDSAGVIEGLVDGLESGRNWITLKGNHDRFFEWFMEDHPKQDPHMIIGYNWFHERIGGLTTVGSYGVKFRGQTRIKDLHIQMKEVVPSAHLTFLKRLSLFHETDGIFFVHAGIRPGIPLDQQDEEDLLWIRHEFLEDRGRHPKLIVHGHTPIDRARHYGNRVNLDTGAGYGDPASVAVFEGDKVWALTNNGRTKLKP